MKRFKRFLEQDYKTDPAAGDVVYCGIDGTNKLCRVLFIDASLGIIKVSCFDSPDATVTMQYGDKAMEVKKSITDRIAIWVMTKLLEQKLFSIYHSHPVGRILSWIMDWQYKKNGK